MKTTNTHTAIIAELQEKRYQAFIDGIGAINALLVGNGLLTDRVKKQEYESRILSATTVEPTVHGETAPEQYSYSIKYGPVEIHCDGSGRYAVRVFMDWWDKSREVAPKPHYWKIITEYPDIWLDDTLLSHITYIYNESLVLDSKIITKAAQLIRLFRAQYQKNPYG